MTDQDRREALANDAAWQSPEPTPGLREALDDIARAIATLFTSAGLGQQAHSRALDDALAACRRAEALAARLTDSGATDGGTA